MSADRRARGLLRPIAIALLLVATASGADPKPGEEAWRGLLPEGWLAIAVSSDVNATEAKLRRVLKDLSYEFLGVVDGLKTAVGAPQLPIGPGDLVIGAALDEDGIYGFGLLPTESFDHLIESVGGEQTGRVAVATLAGVDLCLAPCGRWTMICPLERLAAAREAAGRAAQARAGPARSGTDLALEVSSDGLAFLKQRAASGMPARQRARLLQTAAGWPPNPAALDAAIGQNQPLLERVEKLFVRLRFEASADASGDAVLRLVAELREAPAPRSDERHGSPWPVAALIDAAPRPVIGACAGATRDAALPLVTRLYLAYAAGRPDEIDSPGYAEQEHQAFERAVVEAVSQIDRFEALAVDHGADGPLYSNQAVLLRVRDAVAFTRAIDECFTRWNALVRASDAKIRLLFDASVSEDENLPGAEYSVDMVRAIDSGEAPAIRGLMEAFFGPGGRYAWRLIPLADGLYVMSDLPAIELGEFLDNLPALGNAAAPTLGGFVSVEQAVAWRQRVGAVERGRPAKKPAKPRGRSAPLRFSAVVDGRDLRLRIDAPAPLLRAIGDYLRANR